MDKFKNMLELQEQFLKEIEERGPFVEKNFSRQICDFIEEDLGELAKDWEVKGTLAYDPKGLYPNTRTIIAIERVNPKTGEDSLRIQLMIRGEIVWTIYVEK